MFYLHLHHVDSDAKSLVSDVVDLLSTPDANNKIINSILKLFSSLFDSEFFEDNFVIYFFLLRCSFCLYFDGSKHVGKCFNTSSRYLWFYLVLHFWQLTNIPTNWKIMFRSSLFRPYFLLDTIFAMHKME